MLYKTNNEYWYSEFENSIPIKVKLIEFDYLTPVLPCLIQYLTQCEFGYKRLYCEANQLSEITPIEILFSSKIEELRNKYSDLLDELGNIEVKHQEELSNYNSVAASDTEDRFHSALGKIADKFDKERELINTMDEVVSKPMNCLIDMIQTELKKINIDE